MSLWLVENSQRDEEAGLVIVLVRRARRPCVPYAMLQSLREALAAPIRGEAQTPAPCPAAVIAANFFFASATHLAKSSLDTALTSIGMKGWLMPQIWLHWP